MIGHVRAYNFSSGPAMLPTEVMQTAQSEFLDWSNGMSVLEVSHRSQDFEAFLAATELALREVMGIPDNYEVLFLQGGAYGQFANIPMNLTAAGDVVDFVLTGSWGTKAYEEASKFDITCNVVATEKAGGFTKTPAQGSFAATPGAAYLHYVPNETIQGVEFGYVPDVDVPLVADMSSTILSRPVDVSKFGLIFAGAQKNMGASGLTVVIVSDELIGRARPQTPTVWHYAQMAKARSLLNTPPTFQIYLMGKVLAWIMDRGGLPAMAKLNEAKAATLYRYLDQSQFYSNKVDDDSRSWMNIPFVLAKPELDQTFVTQAAQAGLTNLAGHRTVGGMRASIYNAMPMAGVNALIEFMTEFERTHG